VGAFPVWRPNLDELDLDSAPASAFLILKSFKIIPLQLSCRVPARVLSCLLSDGPVSFTLSAYFGWKTRIYMACRTRLLPYVCSEEHKKICKIYVDFQNRRTKLLDISVDASFNSPSARILTI
jgi:hypothetical protein